MHSPTPLPVTTQDLWYCVPSPFGWTTIVFEHGLLGDRIGLARLVDDESYQRHPTDYLCYLVSDMYYEMKRRALAERA